MQVLLYFCSISHLLTSDFDSRVRPCEIVSFHSCCISFLRVFRQAIYDKKILNDKLDNAYAVLYTSRLLASPL